MLGNRVFIVACALIFCLGATARALNDLAPSGALRVAVLLSNPVLTSKKADGSVGGVSIELAKLIAGKLGTRYELVTYDTTEAYATSFGANDWDVAIGPKTPIAEKTSELSEPFMLVENRYVAAPGKIFANVDEVDRPGVRIAVVVNGAPDQYLSTALKSATLVRIKGSTSDIVEALKAGRADVYGSNGENTYAASQALPGSMIISGSFRTVSMVIAYPKGKSEAARNVVRSAVAEAKTSGLIEKAIAADNLKGVGAAP